MRKRMALLTLLFCGVAHCQTTAPPVTSSKPVILSGTVNLVGRANGGTVVSFTSQFDDENWTAANLIDGTVWDGRQPRTGSNGWASKNAKGPHEIVFAFKGRETKLINKVVLDPTIPDPVFIGRAARDFEVWVSTQTQDGPWKLVLVGTLRNEKKRQEFYFSPAEARFVKLRILRNHGSDLYMALGEFEVYEAAHGIASLDQLIARLEQLLIDLKKYRDQLAEQGLLAVTATASPGEPAPPAKEEPENKAPQKEGTEKPKGDEKS
ncbi:MAG: discoidin domain-containing protein [Armatimonadetes bacterium]|nr:discoidin domain-containing protein [Armatimonadota bacterium]MDW8121420.1 discoidin domain-containing protein [Armatimonadota bacterium]